jgi:hypothetical protein
MVPLLLLHSFPNSITEFTTLIPLLLNSHGSGFTFKVVAPSIPGDSLRGENALYSRRFLFLLW